MLSVKYFSTFATALLSGSIPDPRARSITSDAMLTGNVTNLIFPSINPATKDSVVEKLSTGSTSFPVPFL